MTLNCRIVSLFLALFLLPAYGKVGGAFHFLTVHKVPEKEAKLWISGEETRNLCKVFSNNAIYLAYVSMKGKNTVFMHLKQ